MGWTEYNRVAFVAMSRICEVRVSYSFFDLVLDDYVILGFGSMFDFRCASGKKMQTNKTDIKLVVQSVKKSSSSNFGRSSRASN
jgi:hypothetical protein